MQMDGGGTLRGDSGGNLQGSSKREEINRRVIKSAAQRECLSPGAIELSGRKD